MLGLLLLLAAGVDATGRTASTPTDTGRALQSNVLFIITDDQDVALGSSRTGAARSASAASVPSSVVVFSASVTGKSGTFYPCTRIPSAIRLPASFASQASGVDTILAFAECRRWVGDQCCPTKCCGPNATNSSCPVPAGEPRCSGGCHPANPSDPSKQQITSVDTSDRYICMKRSTDSGVSWSAMQENITQMRSNNPSAVMSHLLEQPQVLLFHNQAQPHSGGQHVMGVWLHRSLDGGKTWPSEQASELKVTNIKGPNIVGPATAAIILPGHPGLTARILLALYAHYDPPMMVAGVNASFAVNVLYSDDGGNRWTRSKTTLPFLGEPSLVALPAMGKNALMVNARCADTKFYNKGGHWSPCEPNSNGTGGHRGVSLSTDGGVTFAPAHYPSDLPSPGCQGSTLLLADKSIAYSGDDSRSARQNMTIKVAEAGQTTFPLAFSKHSPLVSEAEVGHVKSLSGYSALLESSDFRVGALWEGQGGDECTGSSCTIRLSFVPRKR